MALAPAVVIEKVGLFTLTVPFIGTEGLLL